MWYVVAFLAGTLAGAWLMAVFTSWRADRIQHLKRRAKRTGRIFRGKK